jgi:O-succinylbenzoate synthase
MKVEEITLHHIDLPLVHPFETSFGREITRSCILVAARAGGCTGWGECTAMAEPWYSYETIETAWHVLRDFLVPLVLDEEITSPSDVAYRFRRIRGHPMARAALENAVWDLFARAEGVPLADLLADHLPQAGTSSMAGEERRRRERVPVGVSLGIEPSLDALLDKVEQRVGEGYGRVKLKIKPGWDVSVVGAVRERWSNLPLQVDANAAYTLDDAPVLRELEPFDLLLIEQPLHHDDIVHHAKLQAQCHTPICLDESIQSSNHARWALEIDACRVINIKVGRVGGLTAALEIHTICQEWGVPVWCGGMLETNVGRAANVALASLPNFKLPGDISASERYYHEDIAEPDFVLNDDSTLRVPSEPGLGVRVDGERLAAVRLRHLVRRAD